jgi:uncharacterized membrane protein
VNRLAALSKTDRTAWILLLVHVMATIFASMAFATILSGPPPEWLQQEPNKTIYEIGWKVSGPSVVCLGFLAALLHGLGRFGRPQMTKMFLYASLVSLSAELLGTSTGYPFGGYSYTNLLGYRIAELVPFPIPISWTFMLYCSLAMVGRLAKADDSNLGRWKWAFYAGLVLSAWDVAMDPAMVVTAHWYWHEPGFFYGMPFTNWLGWIGTGTVVARVMLNFVSPSEIASRLSGANFPLVLYGVNGVMATTICVTHGFTWAWAGGIVAMGVPLALSLRAAARRRSAGAGDTTGATAFAG